MEPMSRAIRMKTTLWHECLVRQMEVGHSMANFRRPRAAPNLRGRNGFRPSLACFILALLRRPVSVFTHPPSHPTMSRLSVSAPNVRKERRPLTPWELSSLLTPVHVYRRSAEQCTKERPHFAAILGFVYRNRFAVASQIQRRFCHVLRSGRTTRRHLEELEALGFLSIAPGRGVGPLFPKVYYVTGRGVRRLKESLAKHGTPWQPSRIDRRGRDAKEGYAAEQIIHEILITEFMLAVWQTIEGRADLELLNVQRRSLAKHPAFRLGLGARSKRLIPD